MPKVKYVGTKSVKTDNVAGTKTVWAGQGDVQEVDDVTWAKLRKHPDIWECVDGSTAPSSTSPSLADAVPVTPVAMPVAISDIVRKKSVPILKAK